VNADLVYTRFDGKLDRGQAIFFGNTDLRSTPISFALSQPGDFQITTDFHLNLSLRHTFTDWLSFNSSYLKYRNDEDLSEHRTSNVFLPDEPSVLQLAFIRRVADRNVDNVTNYLVANLASGPLRHEALVGFDYYRQDDNSSQWGARGDEFFISAGDSLQGGNVGNIDLESPVYHLNRDPETYVANWFSEPYEDEPARRYSYGVYVQDRVTTGRLDVLLGLRHEWYHDRLVLLESGADEFAHIRQTALIPRIGLVYGLTDLINAYATFSHGFQPQIASVVQQPERFGGPFDPEISELLETGLKNSLLGGRLLTTLALYQISKRNVLVSANVPSEPDLLEQRGEVRSRGAEIDIVGSVSPSLQITANYALNETVVTEGDDPAAIGRINENAPRHQGGFWGKYTLRSGSLAGVSLGVGTRFVSERNTFEGTLQLPGYAVFDASASYRVSQFVVTAYMDNILDETYWLGGYNYGRIYPGAPRTFRVKVGYTF
jgi:iron complex outermembrane receptor protein